MSVGLVTLTNSTGPMGQSDEIPVEGIWRKFKEYLTVDIDVGQPEMVELEQNYVMEAVLVEVLVKNRAPVGADDPTVVFTGIGLSATDTRRTAGYNRPEWVRRVTRTRFETEPQTHSENPPTAYSRISGQGEFSRLTPDEQQMGDALFPGDSVSYTLIVPTQDAPFAQFRVDANVSRRHLWRFEPVLLMPETLTRPPVVESIRSFNALEIHEPLGMVLGVLPEFGSQTLLSEIQALRSVLDEQLFELASWSNHVIGAANLAPNRELRGHYLLAYDYLRSVTDAIIAMQEAVAANDSIAMGLRGEEIYSLVAVGDSVDDSTELLLGDHGISDTEGGYKFRSR